MGSSVVEGLSRWKSPHEGSGGVVVPLLTFWCIKARRMGVRTLPKTIAGLHVDTGDFPPLLLTPGRLWDWGGCTRHLVILARCCKGWNAVCHSGSHGTLEPSLRGDLWESGTVVSPRWEFRGDGTSDGVAVRLLEGVIPKLNIPTQHT